MTNALYLQDDDEKLRVFHMASERIERVLTDLVPTAGSVSRPRLFQEDAAR